MKPVVWLSRWIFRWAFAIIESPAKMDIHRNAIRKYPYLHLLSYSLHFTVSAFRNAQVGRSR